MGVYAIVFLVITAFFAIRGYFNGFWGSLARTVSFVGAYGAAFYFSKPAAAQVKMHTPIDGIAAYITGGIAVFIVVMIGIRLIFWILAKLTPGNDKNPGAGSRIAGLLVGALVGAFVGLLLVYTLDVYNSAKDLKAENNEPTAPAKSDPVGKAAKLAVSKSAGAIMSLSGADRSSVKLGEAFIADPVDSVDRVTRVSNNPDLQKLLNDSRAQRLMKEGDVDELMKVPEFRRLMENQDMKHLLEASGLGVDSKDSARETAKKITLGWQRVQLMKNDPRVQSIVNDPEFRAQMQAENKLPLLANPKLNELAEIIFVDGTGSIAAFNADNQITIKEIQKGADASVTEGEAGTVYRYTDEHGQVHYSDKPTTDR